MTKTMAELIDIHQWGDLEGGCLCGWRGEYRGYLDHAEGEFTAAGFGLVADAGAKALEDAADSISAGGNISRWLRARARAIRSNDAL